MTIGINGVERIRTELVTHDTDIKTDVGDFSAQSHLATLLAALGIPDTDSKPLYTCLVTDRLDNGTIGQQAIKDEVEGLAGSVMVGTDNAALAAVLGALADAAAAGEVTEADTGMAYLKQIVNMINGATGIATWAGGAAPGDNVSLHEVLEQVYDDMTLALADTSTDGVVLGSKVAAFKKLVGESQITTTTEDLNQAAAIYDLFTGTIQAVLLKALTVKMPAEAAGGDVTSIAVATDDETPGVFFDATVGAVANLTSEAELSWTGAMRINTDTKIQLTIGGGSHPTEYLTTITAEYGAIADGGYLVETP